ncbi:MAG: DegV family protein [Anaerolineaceae bacterium]
MSIKIVTDSTSDIPQQVREELDISVVPLYVNMNGKSYLDMLDLSRQEFYSALPSADPHPTTAAPSPGQFIEIYQRLADAGASAVFSIHLAGSLSAVYRSAREAASLFTEIPVTVVDSGNLSLALGLIVIQAAKIAKNGGSVEQVQQELNRVIPRAHAFAKLDTIDHLLKGGRITAIQHSVISLLGIKPILKMNNYVSRMEMARTQSKAYRRVLKRAREVIPTAEVFGITHANAAFQVAELLADLRLSIPDLQEPYINEVNPALGTHVGPGALCINWIEKETH